MKKRNIIVGILLVVLLFVFAPSAHAGVGNTDSGGSSLIDSGGGSSWSDGGSSWSDGGSSWSGGSSSYSSGSGTESGRPIENNYEAIRRIRKLDPMFDEDRFLSQVKLVYLQLQSAWTEKDWNSVRNLESTSLYEQHLTQLQEHIRAKTTNVLERVRVEDSKIKDFIENPEGNDRIEVILSSSVNMELRQRSLRIQKLLVITVRTVAHH